MAISDRGRRLTARHRLAQLRLSRELIKQVLLIWRSSVSSDPSRVRESFINTLPAFVALTRRYRQDSVRLAVEYYQDFGSAELDALDDDDDWDDDDDVRRAVLTDKSEIDNDHVARSINATGPGAYARSRRAGHPPSKADTIAMNSVAADMMRITQNGGREAIAALVEADPKAVGWARITDGDPCAFCAMLASRGPVYTSAERAGSDWQFHNGCGCTVEPVFDVDSWEWPKASKDFEKLWIEVTKGLPPGEDKANAFRRAYEKKRRQAKTES